MKHVAVVAPVVGVCVAMMLAVGGCTDGGTAAARATPQASATDAPARGGSAPTTIASPEFADCESIQVGDAVDLPSVSRCDPSRTPVRLLECERGTYVHLTRPRSGDLEAIVGYTPTWKAAGTEATKYGRTMWAFQNCTEHD